MKSPPEEFDQAQSVAAAIAATTNLFEQNSNVCARRDAELLVAHIVGCQTTDLWRHDTWHEGNISKLWQMVMRRLKHEPVAHITGEQEFWSLNFKVSKDTLIPRPDTETLVEVGVRAISKNESPTVLDVGTGSGCVLISLLHEHQAATGIGLDISNAAIKTGKENAERLSVSARAEFMESDVFSEIKAEAQFDLIVSNPPYIERSAIDELMPDVRLFEPVSALDGGNDGFDFYRILAEQCMDYLKPGGVIAVEVGHTQAKKVARLFEQQGLTEVNSYADLAAIQRVVSAKKS